MYMYVCTFSFVICAFVHKLFHEGEQPPTFNTSPGVLEKNSFMLEPFLFGCLSQHRSPH